MTKNNRKKAVAQAIFTAVALGWAIMQVESAQAATFVVNNLNDSGAGSLRDTINIANSNDVVEFLLGTHPSTISLTSGALAMPAVVTEPISIRATTLILKPGSFISKPVPEPSAIAVGSNNSGAAGEISITGTTLILKPGSFISKPVPEPSAIAVGSNHSGAAGSITVTASDVVFLTTVRKPSAIAAGSNNSGVGGNIAINVPNGFIVTRPAEPSAIAAGNINSGAAGEISITVSSIFLTTVPEPSAIAGIILAGSLAWLAKKKQAAFRKAKV